MTHPAHTPASQHTRLPPAGATGRALRARTEPMTVRPLRDRRYVVETDGGTYVVDIERRTCTCPDHAIRGTRCKHLRRVAIEITERRVPAPTDRPAVCAVCGRTTFVPFDAGGAQLCDRHALRPGDVVIDRETGSPVRVVAVTTERADATETQEGRLVADYPSNHQYGGHEPVVDAVYLEDGESPKRYRFPASRLRRRPVERNDGERRRTSTPTDGRTERHRPSAQSPATDGSTDSSHSHRAEDTSGAFESTA